MTPDRSRPAPVTLRDGWRLALGTLTAVPTPPPSVVTPGVARVAVLLAPLAALPLGAGVLALAWVGGAVGWSPLVLALLAVGWVALGTRVLHWDGLSDTADGLTSSYDRERALAVMKTGTSGPAGVTATVVVAGLQVAGIAGLLGAPGGALAAATAVCLARLALSLTCVRGVRPARKEGLGHPLAGVVAPWQTGLLWIVCAALTAGGLLPAGVPASSLVSAFVLAALTVGALVVHCVRRLGGVTGDVYGAGVEIALAALLLGLSVRF